MAEYINDSGPYDMDSQFSGTKGVDYNYDETTHLVWFSGTGTSSTGFTLPNSEWILYEVYSPDSYTNALSSGTTIQSKKEWTNEIGTIATTLSTWKAAYDIATIFATYKIKATHYKGSDLADVYFADEGEGFSLTGGTEEGVTDGDYTGHSSELIISDLLLADSVASEDVPIYLAMSNGTPTATAPSGVTINNLGSRAVLTVQDINDAENTDIGATFQLLWEFSGTSSATITGDDSGCLPDMIMEDSWRGITGAEVMEIYAPTGYYTVMTMAQTTSTETGNTTRTEHFVGGEMKEVIASQTYNVGGHCMTWENIPCDGTTPITVSAVKSRETGGYYCYINGIKLTRTSSATPTYTELWDGTWYDEPDKTYFFDSGTLPTEPSPGETCGTTNFYNSGTTQYVSSAIDVSDCDSVVIRRKGYNRSKIMYKKTSDGLCYYREQQLIGAEEIIDTSAWDSFRTHVQDGSTEPSVFSVRKIT